VLVSVVAAESLSVLPFRFQVTPDAGADPSCAVSVSSVLVRFALSTLTPTVEDSVQLDAPRASVKPAGAEPYLES
jgi:hypothetical protein